MTASATDVLEARADAASRSFLGWRMVGVAFVAQLVGTAVTFSAFGNFLIPISEAFGAPRGTVGLGIPIAILSMGLCGPIIGRLLDQGRARRLMAGGALASGVGLLLLAQARELWQVTILFCGVVCVGAAFFGMMSSMALVANWFVRRRGVALGLTVAGATIASYLAPALAEVLIDGVGWRMALRIFGLLTLVVCVPLFGWTTIGRPELVGQLPDGEPPGAPGERDPLAGAVALETRELVRDPRLWLVAVGFGLVLTSPIVLVGLLIPFGKDLGLSGQEANLFFLAMIPFSLLGKLAIGALADYLPPKPAIAFVVAVNVLVWGSFLLEPSQAIFVATGAVYGIGIGGAAPLQGVVVGLCFGRLNFGRAQGLGGLVGVPLMAAASTTNNLLFNATGGYQTGFVLQMGLVSLGGLLLLFVRIPRSEAEYTPSS
jgi:MFS family permease